MIAGGESLDHFFHVWEVASCREVFKGTRHIGNPRPVTAITFAGNRTMLASATWTSAILVWDLSLLVASGQAEDYVVLDSADDVSIWRRLGDADPAPAFRAAFFLLADKTRAVDLLKSRLTRAPDASPERIKELITDLDHSQFVRRERASKQLELLGLAAEPALRAALSSQPPVSLEAKSGIVQLLEPQRLLYGADRTRQIRSLCILEHTNSPEALTLLRELSQGNPLALLSIKAKEAYTRLTSSQ
jgi:hypothetical protein